MDLPHALTLTIRNHVDAHRLDGVDDWRHVSAELDDDLTGDLVCDDHEATIAQVQISVEVTDEAECVECAIASCKDCNTFHHKLCATHYAAVQP